jgi:pimeloyl-ACP methyl ester carboxylesterase
VTFRSFRQVAYLLGGTYSASSMARTEGLKWPPPPVVSLRQMLLVILSRPMQVTSVPPADEPCTARTALGAGYFDAPAELLDGGEGTEERLALDLRRVAQLRDGNAILRTVAVTVAGSSSPLSGSIQTRLTAMTQLAVTGSHAFAAWSANPTNDLTPYLIEAGMPPDAAATASQAIMSDFNAARQAVRNPGAGINESSLRQGLRNGNWICVSGEDDPPDFPVNVAIAPFRQYHLPITVPTPLGPNNSRNICIRYIIASSQDVDMSLPCAPQFQGVVHDQPDIPPGNEVVIYIHGEGSRAEEALDFIPALFSVGAAAGRSFTVIAFDQPSCGYSTMVPHLSVAPMPPSSSGPIDTSDFGGSPILAFVENAIVTFVETLVLPLGNPITAVVGGSLGGHMALRLAASQKDWLRNVVAWSPASVMEYDVKLLGVSISHRTLSDPVTAGRATDGPSPPWPASPELDSLRGDFFSTVWDQDTANVAAQYGSQVAEIAGALIAASFFAFGVFAALVAAALLGLTPVPAQPLMWYRDDWPSGVPTVQVAPWAESAMVGPAKAIYIQESRRDRREVYNADFRRWHWRICEEMTGFTFDALVPNMNKPLLLMVGEKDDYPDVHFLSYVQQLAQSLSGLGKCLTVQDTGHSIHNERPNFLASQLVAFAPRP